MVAIPLMIVSAVTTHLNARISLSRQSPEAAANPQAKIMNQLMLWAFPTASWSPVRSGRWRSSSTWSPTTCGPSVSSTTCSRRWPRRTTPPP